MDINTILKSLCLFYIFPIYIGASSGRTYIATEVLFGGSIQFTIDTNLTNNYLRISHNYEEAFELNFNNEVIQIDSNHPDCIEWVDNNTYILSNISQYSQGTWHFGKKKFFILQLDIAVKYLPATNSTIATTLGSSIYIDCSLNNQIQPTYCSIVNNHGKTVSGNHLLAINPVKLEDVGTWKCKMGLHNSIREFIHDVIVKIKPDENINSTTSVGTMNKESKLVELKCTIKKPTFRVNWCRAVSPSGEYFTLIDGHFADKYSSIGTKLNNNTCGIEIHLPLSTTTDVGRWRIDIGETNDVFTGCFFDVPDDNITLPIIDVKEKRESIEIGKSMLFEHSVPWPIKYCYVMNPNGDFLYSKNIGLLQIGVCKIIVKSMTLQGRWTCGIPSRNDTEELQFHTQVFVLSGGIIFDTYGNKPIIGKPFKLTCKSQVKIPMAYCRFISPTHKGYSSSSNLETSNSESSGLDKGECVLYIKKLQLKDLGIWTCAASFAPTLTIFEEYATLNLI